MALTRSKKLQNDMKEKGLKLPHGYTVAVRKKVKSKSKKK
jgi:hypothetical protein